MMFYINLAAENGLLLLTALTALIVFYYTKETFLLRKEAQKQTQSQFTPYIALRNLEGGATLSNLGKGVALHVQVDEQVEVDSGKILLIPSIGSGEERKLYHMNKRKDGAYTLMTRELPDKIGVTYSDIMGNKYEASFSREYPGFGVFKEDFQKLISSREGSKRSLDK